MPDSAENGRIPGRPGSQSPPLEEPAEPREPVAPEPDQAAPEPYSPTGQPMGPGEARAQGGAYLTTGHAHSSRPASGYPRFTAHGAAKTTSPGRGNRRVITKFIVLGAAHRHVFNAHRTGGYCLGPVGTSKTPSASRRPRGVESGGHVRL
jgi:hypothetical protein